MFIRRDIYCKLILFHVLEATIGNPNKLMNLFQKLSKNSNPVMKLINVLMLIINKN